MAHSPRSNRIRRAGRSRPSSFIVGAFILAGIAGVLVFAGRSRSIVIDPSLAAKVKEAAKKVLPPSRPPLDKGAYDRKMLQLANIPVTAASSSSATSTAAATSSPPGPWPVKAPYPNPGAILPFKRIVAYYGNLYSKQMGVLGQYPEDQMLDMLRAEADKWQAADPSTPVMPALDYIVVAAQASAGADGKYRLRMPDDQIETILDMAAKVNGVVFLDIQVGLSNVKAEVPLLEKYLKLPQVHLALDPEFSMKSGARPGTEIGTMDATDVNYAAEYLADLVRANDLPPKILVVHRFTQAMVSNYRSIRPLPEVQIIMDADGFGSPAQKMRTYHDYIFEEPVQFTGFKLFYKNDARAANSHLMTPEEVLKLRPQPSYIQYQ